jgi:hypothetical protein
MQMRTSSDVSVNNGLPLVAPRVVPVLDPAFRPAVLAARAFRALAAGVPDRVPVRLAIEQADGSVFRFDLELLPDGHPQAAANAVYLERFVKFVLWSRGGWRLHLDAPAPLVERLRAHYRETPTGRFDADLVAARMFDHPLAIERTQDLPPARSETRPLGRHLDGCRIGFDLGGSDRKVAALVDGTVVFSEEVVWDPYHQPDPQYHYDGIMDSLTRAAAHLPRVDAIGGSAAGVYVNNRVKAGSLFRGVPPDLFESRVKDLFLEIRRAWNDVPFEVVNDGEVTALAGSMSLGVNAILGIALGTSTAAGYVTADGTITSWLDELAFVPVDYNPAAAVDEWSGDYGVGSQYFSQQCVGRLMPAAGIEAPPGMGLPDRLKLVQALMKDGDPRAPHLRDDRHLSGLRRRPLRRLLRPAARAGARPRDVGPGRRRHARRRARGAEGGVPRSRRAHRVPRAQRDRQAPRSGHCRGEPAGGDMGTGNRE